MTSTTKEQSTHKLFDQFALPENNTNSANSISDKQQTKSTNSDSNAPNLQSENSVDIELKKALVYLMKQGVVLKQDKPEWFSLLFQQKQWVKSYLDTLFLESMFDEDSGLILLRQQDIEDEKIPALITRQPLDIFDTVLLIVLREFYQEKQFAGHQQILIDREQLEALISTYLPATGSNTLDNKKLNGRLQNLKENRILLSNQQLVDHYIISPLIRFVVDADMLEQMLAEYRAIAKEKLIPLKEEAKHE